MLSIAKGVSDVSLSHTTAVEQWTISCVLPPRMSHVCSPLLLLLLLLLGF